MIYNEITLNCFKPTTFSLLKAKSDFKFKPPCHW